MKRLLFLVAVVVGIWLQMPAQISYTVSYHSAAGNPGGVNPEQDYELVGWTPLLPGGLPNNQWSGSAGLPFTFQFFGEMVTSYQVSANGLLTFTPQTGSPPDENTNLPSYGLPNKTIACFWERFTTAPPTGTNDQVQTKLFGTAPYRQLWIRWYSFEWGPSSFAYVAIVLEETTNKIYLVDMYGSLTSNWVTASVGVQKNGALGVQAGNDQLPLSGAGSSDADNSYYEFIPFQIPPQDVRAVEISSPTGESCGLGQEPVKLKLTNVGELTASNIQVRFSVDGGLSPAPELVPFSIPPGDTLVYTFTAQANLTVVGSHSIKAWADSPGDPNHSNDTTTAQITHVRQVSDFPYKEDFESGSNGWYTGGVNVSWELGTPANSHIQGAASGQKAWITNRLGSHNSYESSWVLSPCFDLTNAGGSIWVMMKVWWESEASWDGAVLQVSVDDGGTWLRVGNFGAPDWYNSGNIGSLPGGQPQGWSGMAATGSGSGGWVAVTHKLPSITINQPRVRFRIAFASGGSVNADGFAFDDFTLGTLPNVPFGPDGYYCDGDTIDAGNPGMDHLWSTGDTSQRIILTNPYTYPILDSMITVKVTNALGLFRRDTLRFSLSRPLEVIQGNISPAACAGEASGSVSVLVNHGLSPYYYTWNTGSHHYTLDSVAAGAYSVTVVDANGCEASAGPFVVTEPDSMEISTQTVDNACFGDTQGQISLSVSGGSGSYAALWEHGPTGLNLTELPAGVYSATVHDGAGCSLPVEVVISEPDSLEIAFVASRDAACPISANGSITLALQGGTWPYTYLWSNGNTDSIPSDLMPGSYSVDVTDAHGCISSAGPWTITYEDSLPTALFDFRRDAAIRNKIMFDNNSTGAETYHWSFGDGNSSTDENPTHFYRGNGSYLVTLIINSACGTDTMEQYIDITGMGIGDEGALATFTLFPNPSTGQLKVQLNHPLLQDAQLCLFTADGRRVWTQAVGRVSGAHTIALQLPGNLSQGIYTLRLSAQEGRWFRRVQLE
ncbi:MAG: T9SS C-terminal target domain-containing protein [Bacteroidetes bacterium]|nr:MAG: T9SS C-terminal target domain-containing protein [Bacteroidota bacterium]